MKFEIAGDRHLALLSGYTLSPVLSASQVKPASTEADQTSRILVVVIGCLCETKLAEALRGLAYATLQRGKKRRGLRCCGQPAPGV